MMTTLSSNIHRFGDEQIQDIITKIADAVEEISYKFAYSAGFNPASNEKNVFGDAITIADDMADELFFTRLKNICHLYMSEERESAVLLNENALYDVTIDPLDGSSNLEINAPVGSIFSIIDKTSNKLVVAGYALYGSTTTFVISTSRNVKMFSLVNESENILDCFELINDSVICPFEGKRYSINESYSEQWKDSYTKRYVNFAKENSHVARNFGCMVADCHAILIKGGLFAYPGTDKHPNGKLRTAFEVRPFAFIFSAACGMGYTTTMIPFSDKRFFDSGVAKMTTPVVFGSVTNINEYFTYCHTYNNE